MAGAKKPANSGMTWKVVAAVSAMAATALSRKATELAWKKAARREPPSPKNPDSKWAEALAFAAISGAIAGAAKLVATRKAAESWRSMTGVLPPGLDEVV